MKLTIVSFLMLVSLNMFGQTQQGELTRYSANKDTLYILDADAVGNMVSLWSKTYTYTEHTSINNQGETVKYWETASTNKPSVIVSKTETVATANTVNYTEHTVMINDGSPVQCWKASANNNASYARSWKAEAKDKPTGAGLKQ